LAASISNGPGPQASPPDKHSDFGTISSVVFPTSGA
jgi:hypothetical protein